LQVLPSPPSLPPSLPPFHLQQASTKTPERGGWRVRPS
jgi:hypothetical protein